jgi:hypothetical protein
MARERHAIRPLIKGVSSKTYTARRPATTLRRARRKRPDQFELVFVTAVLLENSFKRILRALAHAPTHLPERQLIPTYRWKRRVFGPLRATEAMTPERCDRMESQPAEARIAARKN